MLEESKNLNVNNYKNSMNNQWQQWVYRQVSRNVSLSKIENVLREQNYNPQLIYNLL